MDSSKASDERGEAAPLGKRATERIARRTRLLDAAETRFAEAGYAGTVLREVTARASTRLSSVTDEFGGKEQLFREVLMRRALPLEELRREHLDRIDPDRRGKDRLTAVVHAYTDPMLRLADSEGWRNYFRFLAQLANSSHTVQIAVAGDYNRSARHFMDAFQVAAPHADDETVHDAFLLMLANALEVFAATRRIDSLSDGRFHGADLDRRCRAMQRYVTAGVSALLDP